MDDPVDPDRHPQKKYPILAVDLIGHRVAEEGGEADRRGIFSLLINAHLPSIRQGAD
jgi:hypothetical protein